jgi:hypothetical protein
MQDSKPRPGKARAIPRTVAARLLRSNRPPSPMLMTQPPVAKRTLREAALDALPDALAALACAIAWIAPAAPGFDLLAYAAPLYFVELPLAIVTTLAGVRRIQDGRLSRRDKLRFVLGPTVVLLLLATALLGWAGAIGVAWLGATQVSRLLWQGPDTRSVVPGLWLIFGRPSTWFDTETFRPPPAKGVYVVPVGHEQLMAMVTIAMWFVIPVAFLVLPDFGIGAADEAYATAVGWRQTVIGRLVPAHVALAAGLILFAVRALCHFEDAGAPPPADIETDPLLQDVIDEVEGRRPRAGARRKR